MTKRLTRHRECPLSTCPNQVLLFLDISENGSVKRWECLLSTCPNQVLLFLDISENGSVKRWECLLSTCPNQVLLFLDISENGSRETLTISHGSWFSHNFLDSKDAAVRGVLFEWSKKSLTTTCKSVKITLFSLFLIKFHVFCQYFKAFETLALFSKF